MINEIASSRIENDMWVIYFRSSKNQKAYNKFKNFLRFHLKAEVKGGRCENVKIFTKGLLINVVNTDKYHHFFVVSDLINRKYIIEGMNFFNKHSIRNGTQEREKNNA